MKNTMQDYLSPHMFKVWSGLIDYMRFAKRAAEARGIEFEVDQDGVSYAAYRIKDYLIGFIVKDGEISIQWAEREGEEIVVGSAVNRIFETHEGIKWINHQDEDKAHLDFRYDDMDIVTGVCW